VPRRGLPRAPRRAGASRAQDASRAARADEKLSFRAEIARAPRVRGRVRRRAPEPPRGAIVSTWMPMLRCIGIRVAAEASSRSNEVAMNPIRSGAIVLLLLGASAAEAEPSPALDRISVSLGGYYADTDIRLSASSERYGIGETSFEPHSGRDTLGRARLDFLIGDHQGLQFDYFGFRRSREQTLQRSFDIGGSQFDVGAHVRGRFNLDLGSAAYRWWFGDGPSVFGLGVGAAYYRVKVGLSADVSAGGVVAGGSERYDADAVAPLLTLGWRYAPSDAWRVYADASGIKKNGGTLAGHAWNAAAGVEWFPFRNAGIGLEYAVTRVHLERDASQYDARLDLRLDGPAAYLRLRF
jgi:hypothetical protein